MSQLNDVIKTAIDNIQQIVDANTIIGTPINTDNGTTIIPVSKISIGIASGGVDYASKSNNAALNFGGGNGAGVSVTPVGFLIVPSEGDVRFIKMNSNDSSSADTVDSINRLISKAPDIFDKLKEVFKSSKKEDTDISNQ